MPTLSISTDSLAWIIEKAREFDAEVEVDDPDSGSNSSDDNEVAILEDTDDNPVEQELASFLSDLNDDAMAELLALMWIGRGDFDRRDWSEALRSARTRKNAHAVSYLMGTPMLGDLIEEGLAALDISVPLPQEDPQVPEARPAGS